MKFTARRETLSGALQIIRGAVTNKSTLPILMNILLEVEDSNLRLTATDLKISIQTQVEVEVEEEGSCTVPADKFRNLVQELPSPDTELMFETEDEQATITVPEVNSHFQMPVLPAEEYPSLPEVEDGQSFEMESDQLDDILKNCTFAASTDSSRSYLCGVNFDIKPDELVIVATDAHRLALHRTRDQYGEHTRSFLLPIKAANELSKILPQDRTLTIRNDDNLVAFEMGSIRLISRLIDEDFPNYEQVIPDEFEKRLKVDIKRFYDAVKRVSLMADEKTRRLVLEVEPSELTVRAETSEKGGGEEVVPIEYNGEPQSVAFNGDYLAAILNHVEDPEVYFDLISEDSPGTFRPIEGDEYLYIVMPLRL